MPNASTPAFVLGTTVFNEQDKLVHLLTVQRGILKAIAPGSLKVRNRFGALLELFTEGEFQYYWKEDKELITLSRGDLLQSNFNLVSDARHIFYFYLIAEVLLRFIPYDHKDKRIYRLVRALLESGTNRIPVPLLLLYFFIWILRIEGMMFSTRACSSCSAGIEAGTHSEGTGTDDNSVAAWLRTDFMGLLCRTCRSNETVSLTASDLRFIKWTEKGAPAALAPWQARADCSKLIRFFKNKIEYHGEFSLKSTQYLAEFK
ncbi:MAG: DNA repair protein RecO [bacterium]|nr:DNA repair protein RecO [bacterium]